MDSIFDSINLVRFFDSFVIWVIQGSILILIVYIMNRLAKNLSAAHRYFIWTLTFVGILFLPILNTIVPGFYKGASVSYLI